MLIEVRTLDKNSNPLKVSKGDTLPIQHTVESNTRVEIYMDGQKQNGQSAAGAPTKKLTKVGKNLVLSEEDKPLVELVNFYGEADVTLVGDNWSAADTQLTAVSEGLAFQEAAPLETAALVAAGPSTLTWVLGGVAAVGLGGGGGGGGGGSTTTTTSTTPSASTTIAAALAVIKDYSGSNTVPTLSHYQAAGVTGVTDGNLSAINSAISPLVSGVTDTTAKVQAVVDAYKAVLASADGTGSNGTTPTQAQYATLGLKGVDTPEAQNLLGDVIDRKSNDDVNTVDKLQDLADKVAAVMKTAKGDTSASVTETQLTALGITKVNPNNIKAIQAAIEKTKDDGSEVGTLSDLQRIVNTAASQLKIQTYGTETPSAEVPNSIDYSNIGVTDVTDGAAGNLNAINSSIGYLGVNDTNTSAKVQNVVNAYNAILEKADGKDNSKDTNFSSTLPTAEQYAAIGVKGFKGLDAGQVKARVDLLRNAIDLKSMDGVDTLGEVQKLVDTVDKLMKRAANNLPSEQAISKIELETLGLKYLTAANLGDFLVQVASTDDAGTGINTLQKLQYFVDANGPQFEHATTEVIENGRMILKVDEGIEGPLYTAKVIDLNSVTYSISQDDGRNFQIDSKTGVVKFISRPDYETPLDSPGFDSAINDTNSYYFNITATDTSGNKTDQFISLYVKNVVDAGDPTLGLGAGFGQLINPKIVEGKWYYHWDKNGNGIADVGDAVTNNDLSTFLKYNSKGEANTSDRGTITDEFRFGTLNGIKIALPTLGFAKNFYGVDDLRGSNYDLLNPDSKNKTESKHNDLFAIWDAYNGDKTLAFDESDPASFQNGTPTGWMQGLYWASTNNGIFYHEAINFSNGDHVLGHNTQDHEYAVVSNKIYAAFQVL